MIGYRVIGLVIPLFFLADAIVGCPSPAAPVLLGYSFGL